MIKFFYDAINWAYAKYAACCSLIVTPIVIYLFDKVVDFYAPVGPYIGYLALLGGVDFFTGIWASRKEQESVTSHKMKPKFAIVSLFLLVLTCILAMDHMLKSAHDSMPPFITILWMIFYGFYELFSVCENAVRINPNLPIKPFIKLIKEKSGAASDIVNAAEEAVKEKKE